MNPLMNPVGSNAEGKLNCINAVVITQKTITIDFLTGKRKINEGEVTQYYVSNAHDPIVSAEVFEMVQNALKYRRETNLRFSGFYPLGGRVFCSSCGSFFGHKILQRRRNGRLTRKEIWRCNSYYDGDAHPHSIKDSQMVDGLAAALQTVIDSNMDVVDLCWEMMKAIHPRLQRPKYIIKKDGRHIPTVETTAPTTPLSL